MSSDSFKEYQIPFLSNRSVNGHENITFSGTSLTLFYPCPGFTECSPYTVSLPRGRYFLEVYGASSFKQESNGGGGYSSGFLNVDSHITFYVYVGSCGVEGIGHGGYNGGGAIPSDYWLDESHLRRVGGGSTDIRTIYGSEVIEIPTFHYKTQYFGPIDSLESRFIVAGGAGTYHGGGLVGGGSYPGTQTDGGTGDYDSPGGFGYGGSCSSNGYGISGGGGGWYGGGGSTFSSGGSGYVNNSILHQGLTIGGNEYYQSHNGIINQGNKGDGAARITFLDLRIECTFVRTHLFPSIVLFITQIILFMYEF